jgi:nitrile hydratase
MGGAGLWNLDQTRSARESLPPAQYLASSYYRIWLDGLSKLMLERGLVTREELREGRMREAPVKTSVLTPDRVAAALARGAPTARPTGAARFAGGDAVRTREINPPTHTRLPRYCRGKRGAIVMLHGAHVFPDANASGGGEDPQWLYTVRFDGAELWGPHTSAAAVHVDCWEPYLDMA